MDKKLTTSDSVKDVLGDMTLEEKGRIITGASSFGTAAIPRLGIPPALIMDGGSGINLRQYLSNLLTSGTLKNEKLVSRYGGASGNGILSELVYIMDHVNDRGKLDEAENELLDDFLNYLRENTQADELPSAMPVNTLLAASWNPAIVYDCGKAVGEEASAFGLDLLLGSPCVNIQRDPLGGRGFEGYSEDPCLTAGLAPWYVRGVKESGVLTNVKHFAANNQETNRKTIQEWISERALYEIYFPAFKACVQEGQVDTVMMAYNWINGEACAQNKWLIEKVLREEWGYKGKDISDWGGVYDRAKGISAGTDLTMPMAEVEPVLEAVNKGEIQENEVNQCAERVLNTLLQMPVMKGRKKEHIDFRAHRETAYRAACEGIVLLKNEKNTLPLTNCRKVGIMENGEKWKETGIGSGRVHTDKTSSLERRLIQNLGADMVSKAGTPDQDCDTIIVTVSAAGQEGMDRESMELDQNEQLWLKQAIQRKREIGSRLVVILNISGPVDLRKYLEEIDALLCVYFPGQEGGNAAGDILCGKINPSGKIPHTFPLCYTDTPSFGNFPGEDKKVLYGEGIFVGYRYYDTKNIKVLFPFGFGLSYTQFQLEDCFVEKKVVDIEKETADFQVKVSNIGDYDGKEVVQVYIHKKKSFLQKPEKELKAFKKILVRQGENKIVRFSLRKEDFCSYDPAVHRWVCEPGDYEIWIGNSSRNIVIKEKIQIKCRNEYQYGEDTDYRQLVEDERALEVIEKNLPKGCFTKEEIRRGVEVYYPQRVTFKEAFPIYLGIRLKEYSAVQQQEIYASIVQGLGLLDPPSSDGHYRETEIY